MNKLIFLFSFLFGTISAQAQELNCQVIVNSEQTGQSNLQVFKTLERSLTEFINQNSWTKDEYENHERINCSVFINITGFENETFTGTIQVQSSRPVYGSSMITPVFNFNDEQFSFSYREFEPLNYSQNSYSSNLVSVISFYVYTILGLDADTFAPMGGSQYYEEANRIVNTAQQGNAAGWRSADGARSRNKLNSDLLSNAFTGFRESLYTYHRQGLDIMHKDAAAGKKAVANSISKLGDLNSSRPNSLLVRVFFDAKAQEIEQIFGGGPSVPVTDLLDDLNQMAPIYSENWSKIKF